MAMAAAAGGPPRPMSREDRKVILASSVGTIFEWYDFYLAGALAANIAANFFSGVNPTAGFIFTLLGFAAGFAVRPFGALFFGSLGDLIGRKYTFLVTMTLMGIATFVVGLLPSYASIGFAAPVLFIALPPAAGPGARRRVWRCGDLRRRARPAGPPRLLHLVDPDHGDRRPVPLADRGPGAPPVAHPGAVRRLGLARAVPAVDPAARRVDLDPSAAGRVAGLRPHQGRGQELQDAAARGLRPLGERQDRPPRPVRRHRRPGGGVVLRPVLRPVLPDPDAEARRHDRQHRDRRGARHRHAVLHLLRLAVATRSAASRSSWRAACSPASPTSRCSARSPTR